MMLYSIFFFLKELVITLAIAITAIVVSRGINSWKRQLDGNIRLDLARRLLRHVYEVRGLTHASVDAYLFQ
jgi:hypothetical protein